MRALFFFLFSPSGQIESCETIHEQVHGELCQLNTEITQYSAFLHHRKATECVTVKSITAV